MARKSRNLGYNSTFYKQSIAAHGFLVLKKTILIAEKVSNAMIARGWSGELILVNRKGISFYDSLLVFPAVLIFVAILVERFWL